MSTLCLNCRGLCDLQAVKKLRGFLRRIKPSIIFLSEMKLSGHEMRAVKNKLGSFLGVYVDSKGRAGGLALLCNSEVEVSLLSFSFHHIDCIVRLKSNDCDWRFTGLYGWYESSSKHLTCKLLEDLRPQCDKPWLVGGDLNEIFYWSEKKGGSDRSDRKLELFQNTFQNCDLWDVEFKGYPFTWWNGREDEESIKERLDRFMASTEWSILFPWAAVEHLNECLSDHLSILIKLEDSNRSSSSRGGHGFRFENWWVEEHKCGDVIKDAWDYNADTDPVANLDAKKAACARSLTNWNAETSGNVMAEIRRLEKNLKGLLDPSQRRDTMVKIRELRKKEEMIWWHRSRTNFLRFGDMDTKWFHHRALERKRQNYISIIQDRQGIWGEGVDEIEKVVVDYLGELFTSSDPCDFAGVLDTVDPKITPEMNENLKKPYTGEEVYEALQQMHPSKAPGPDGMNPFFYQHFWSLVD